LAAVLGSWPALGDEEYEPACPVPSIVKDYNDLYKTKAKERLLSFEKVDLDGDGKPELIVSNPEDCDKDGCQYAVYYAKAPKDCYRRIGGFKGRIHVLPRKGPGYRMIEQVTKDDVFLAPVTRDYSYDPLKKYYTQVKKK
jgi:hypothetical protein